MILSKFFNTLVRLRQTKALEGIHSEKRFRIVLERERARCDRSQHEFSLVDFEVGDSETDSNQVRNLAHVLANRIRSIDEAGWLGRQHIGVLLPYTQATGARKLAEDVCQKISIRSLPPKYTIHTYPPISKEPSDRSGNSGPFRIQDIPSKQKTTASPYSSASAKHTGRRKTDFTSQQPKANRTPDCGELAEGIKPFLLRPLPIWKRAMDIVGATVALIVFLPIMIAVAIAIKLTSKGPILFKQQRAGLGGIPFTFYKFRSMVIDAEDRKEDLLKHNERTGPAFKMTNDPRVTRVGNFIRKWSMDELPQLFNVVCGDISLVGPRPLPVNEALQHNQWQDRRLSVTPGITCLWQVYARHDTCFDRWTRLDIEYINERSPLLDLKILLKTLPAVLSRKGAV